MSDANVRRVICNGYEVVFDQFQVAAQPPNAMYHSVAARRRPARSALPAPGSCDTSRKKLCYVT
jgi:hypothetical protein